MLPHSFSQKQAGPFPPITIVPWNIHAGSLRYLYYTHSGFKRLEPSSFIVTYDWVCAPPIAHTSLEKIWWKSLLSVQVSPSFAKSTRSCITSGSLEKPFLIVTRLPYPISLKAVRIASSPQSCKPSSGGVSSSTYLKAICRRDGNSRSHCSSR
jgi:hypothetical protein